LDSAPRKVYETRDEKKKMKATSTALREKGVALFAREMSSDEKRDPEDTQSQGDEPRFRSWVGAFGPMYTF